MRNYALQGGAAVVAFLLGAAPASATFLRVVDFDGPDTGPSFMSAVVDEWTGSIHGGTSVFGPAPCEPFDDSEASWTVFLAVDAFPLGEGDNRAHLHTRPIGYDVPILGTPKITWAFQYRNGASPIPAYLSAEVIALTFNVTNPLADPVTHVVAQGRQVVPAGPGGRFTWDLDVMDPVVRKGTSLALRVDLQSSVSECQRAGLTDASLSAAAFSDSETQSGLEIATSRPVIIASAFGNGTAIRLQAHAAWGVGQLEKPGAAVVAVNGKPATGHWVLDAPTHEDFHAFYNGYRTWVFDPPISRGAVQVTLQAIDGSPLGVDWPTQDLRLQADCIWSGEKWTCDIDDPLRNEMPGPGVGFLVIIVFLTASLCIAIRRGA